MGSIELLFIAFAAISLFICALQLTFSFKRKGDILFLVSSLMSLLVFLHFAIMMIVTNQGTAATQPFLTLRYRLILTQIVTIGFLRVLFYLLKSPGRLLQYIILTLILIIILIGGFLPESILFGENATTRILQLPEGDQIVMIQSGFTLWRLLRDISIVLFVTGSFAMIYKKLEGISFRTAVAIFGGLAIMLGSAFYDQLVDLDIFPGPYMYPFAEFLYYSILTFIPFNIVIEENVLQQNQLQQLSGIRDLAFHVDLLVIRLNRMGAVESVNPYFCKITGYAEKEVLGKDWFEFLIPPKDYYKVQGAFLEVLDSEKYPQQVNPILTKLNEEVQIHWFNARTHDPEGQINGSLSIGVNIDDDIREKMMLKKKLSEAEELISRLSSQPGRG